MIQIRQNIFETNSSSTHSITICREDEYQDWVAGNTLLILYCPYNTPEYEESKYFTGKDFINVKDAHKIYNLLCDNSWKNWDFSEIFATYEEYFDDYYLNTFETLYKDKETGAEYTAFGKYGYDG